MSTTLGSRTRMTWAQALACMRQGYHVRRLCHTWVKEIQAPDPDDDGLSGMGITETGQEGCFLAHAWSVDDKPVMVFMGSDSRCLFVPDGEDTEAADWILINRSQS